MVSEGYFPELSGVTIAVDQHMRYLAAHGHDVLLAHPRYPEDVIARMGGQTGVGVLEQAHFGPHTPTGLTGLTDGYGS